MVIVGREGERTALSRVLTDTAAEGGQALALRGEAGAGKTALLDHAVEEAHGRGFRVLRCSGVESEVELAFGGLHQLLQPVLDRLAALPDVQAQALRGALGLTDPAVTDLLVAAGGLALLEKVAQEGPLLVAVDDMQWLDRPTASALVFAAPSEH